MNEVIQELKFQNQNYSFWRKFLKN